MFTLDLSPMCAWMSPFSLYDPEVFLLPIIPYVPTFYWITQVTRDKSTTYVNFGFEVVVSYVGTLFERTRGLLR